MASGGGASPCRGRSLRGGDAATLAGEARISELCIPPSVRPPAPVASGHVRAARAHSAAAAAHEDPCPRHVPARRPYKRPWGPAGPALPGAGCERLLGCGCLRFAFCRPLVFLFPSCSVPACVGVKPSLRGSDARCQRPSPHTHDCRKHMARARPRWRAFRSRKTNPQHACTPLG